MEQMNRNLKHFLKNKNSTWDSKKINETTSELSRSRRSIEPTKTEKGFKQKAVLSRAARA